MLFWVFVSCLGIFGAMGDIVLNQWSKNFSLRWWLMSAVLFVAFMTGFGIAMRLGAARGYSLTLAVLIVFLVNIMAVGVWDLYGGARFTPKQWLGAVFAIGAIMCFETTR
ncbi:MAG: hypothetical protein UY50_C0018G0006 [Parcubacteria group bacterium GW2011_GWA2_49_9]|nr:MAG: hypothetical protein UY50_C0018G0006 [Parcubacteria group bacterium GW2011_GWA2_49_9]